MFNFDRQKRRTRRRKEGRRICGGEKFDGRRKEDRQTTHIHTRRQAEVDEGRRKERQKIKHFFLITFKFVIFFSLLTKIL
jgi:hypothetical protein